MSGHDALRGFEATLADASPPDSLSPPLRALWHLAKGDWETAHQIAQDAPDPDGAWVHAHLHRVEGDLDNAAYWYRRARRPVSTAPLAEERDEIVIALGGAP